MITEINAAVAELVKILNAAKIKNPSNVQVSVLDYPIPEAYGKEHCPIVAVYKGESRDAKFDTDQDTLGMPSRHDILIDVLDYSLATFKAASESTDSMVEKILVELKKDPTLSGKVKLPSVERISPDYAEGESGWFAQPRIILTVSIYD